jgi:hypothetical protein
MTTELSIDYWVGKRLSQLLSLFVAIALTPSMLLAEDEDHINGRDKTHDPTGAWFLRTSLHTPLPTSPADFALMVFHRGGTLTGDLQGESAFDPSAVPVPPSNPNYGNNVITSPQSGVWQKTGWNTFAATLMVMEYHVSTNPEPGSPILQFTVVQFSGKLTGNGDTMEFTGEGTHYDVNGNQGDNFPFNANGVRIPLTLLPKTINPLPIPSEPQ